MTQLYFHCSNSQRALIDRSGLAVGNMSDARDQAARIMRTLIMAESPEDWRDWVLHVSDELGDEVFVVPFASVLGQLH
jgi:hypothetical protein